MTEEIKETEQDLGLTYGAVTAVLMGICLDIQGTTDQLTYVGEALNDPNINNSGFNIDVLNLMQSCLKCKLVSTGE